MQTFDVPLLIRGEAIFDHLVEFAARQGEVTIRTPDVARYLDRLPLKDPTRLADLYELSFADIVDFLDSLSKRLKLDDNPHMQRAYELSCMTSGLTPQILRSHYDDRMPVLLGGDNVREVAEERIGIAKLEDWTRHQLRDGRIAHTRPFGARCMHVTAGNSPNVAGITTLWNGITRGDAVIKSPSNDPMTSLAIGLTMVEMAPDHPMTRHYSVGYWKGGNTEVESELYRPENFEKIAAWGGFAAMKHITRYLQPGLELVAMDPKLSGTIIGREAFESEETMRQVAAMIARDFGMSNQEGCAAARVISVQSGTDKEGLERLRKLAEYAYDALQALPSHLSSPHPHFSSDLKSEIDSIRSSRFYSVVGGEGNRGAVIVSLIPEPVDFADILGGRVANFVPCDEIEEALDLITIHTQTIGIYPESLKVAYRDKLAFLGGQRIVSIGYHTSMSTSLPHDAIEPLRRLVRWVNDEDFTGDRFQGNPGY